ncbi:hypothetical protein KOI35_26725 [Actinoplanes bogorensis]|uniref:Uncharacterized protein n=1 Tax=Paractinoplanes bogorensis TaxID=1610840 RepID=A0ABS5YUI1_9ACTN|nr:hypothetical protein [Actinoplanes bogorensis]MBU2667107.1 hypothetical protein [Actinoplanes bogorensis]
MTAVLDPEDEDGWGTLRPLTGAQRIELFGTALSRGGAAAMDFDSMPAARPAGRRWGHACASWLHVALYRDRR